LTKKVSKKRKEIMNKLDMAKKYSAKEAIKLLKENSCVKFDETLDIAINLSIDPKKTDQNIRGMINLPHGTGKKIKVAVMAKGEKANEAKESGADLVGDNDLSENIMNGKIDFDILIATPEMMPLVGKLGKILGPKGLMPNPKLGTVTQDVISAVKNAKAGQVQYKNDKSGIVHAGIGKLNFKNEDLFNNLKTFYNTILKSKPEGAKGSFIKKVTIASTMGCGLELNVGDLR
jgi:large subunit ribosomal protein L1